MKKNKKIIILTVFSIILIFLIVFFSRKIFSSVGKTENFYTVTKEIFENVIEISGTVEAAQEQILQALSNGTVIQVYVEEGDYVKKGDVIIQLEIQRNNIILQNRIIILPRQKLLVLSVK